MADSPRPPAIQLDPYESCGPTPMHLAFCVGHDGEMTAEVVEGSFEQVYRIGESFTTPLFLALCRSRGLLPYRRRRQHAGTVCVRATLTDHDVLWASFLELSGQLEARLAEVACAFVHAHVALKPR